MNPDFPLRNRIVEQLKTRRNKVQKTGLHSGPSPTNVEKDSDSDNVEGEGKVKMKLMSMWNNVKYGWTVKTKTNFSKDSPVLFLGKCYDRKMDFSALTDSDLEKLSGSGTGIEAFKLDFISRLWLTYRREFPILNGSQLTTDCGWGCMLRSGQMLLAQALVCHFLGRDWRWIPDQELSTMKLFEEDKCHRNIIKWFGDNPSKSPLSIHRLVALGEASGKKAGDWYGPASVAHLLRQAVQLAAKDNLEFEEITLYVAQDCAVYVQDILDQCELPGTSSERYNQGQSQRTTHSDISHVNYSRLSVTCGTAEEAKRKKSWKSLILLVPVRLGAEKFNSIYGSCLKNVLSLDSCIGIIGGRPKHSLYFVGYQDDKLIHLDPHYCQEVVDVWKGGFPLSSFHCRSPRKMSFSRMDPSCCLGFYCKTREDFESFTENVQAHLVPHNQKAEYPMFVFCEGRSTDALFFKRPNIQDEVCKYSSVLCQEDSEEEFESEEFEIL